MNSQPDPTNRSRRPRTAGARRIAAAALSMALLFLLPASAGASTALVLPPSDDSDRLVVTADWAWPIGGPGQLLRTFEAPPTRYAAGHRGIDLFAGPTDPVRAPADGVVSFAGTVVDRPVLSIQHGEGLVSSFEPVTANVTVGERVTAGQVVGIVATGAHCTQRCVHFGVRRHGEYISPILFLGGLARAVLLPMAPTGPVLPPGPATE